MKKTVTSFAFFVFSFAATAQQGDNQERLQQEPPRETQSQVERAAARDAKRIEEERKLKDAEAEKTKAQAQNQAERKKADLEAEQKSKAKKK